jgi:hypothetical protein
MSSRSIRWLAQLLVLTGAACATSHSTPPPPAPAPPDDAAAGSPTDPVPAASTKRGVVMPPDTSFGAGPAGNTTNTGTAGPAVGPSLGASPAPN